MNSDLRPNKGSSEIGEKAAQLASSLRRGRSFISLLPLSDFNRAEIVELVTAARDGCVVIRFRGLLGHPEREDILAQVPADARRHLSY